MNGALRRIVLISIALIIVILLAFGVFFGYHSITQYTPLFMENIIIEGKGTNDTVPDRVLGFYTWNISNGGLGKEMDFVFEGGKMVRPGETDYKKYRDGIIYQLTTLGSRDFLLLQQVDTCSHRSYEDNQEKRISAALHSYASAFALNHKTRYFPLPVKSPVGKVESGLLTLSGITPMGAERYSYPSSLTWPRRLFMLKSCFLVTRYYTSKGRQLVVINTFHSAIDQPGNLCEGELNTLKKFILEESQSGNYVVVGGDWNQNPPYFNPDSIADGNKVYTITPQIAADYLPEGWKWVYDPTKPTNRNVNQPYAKGITGTTLIDFFLISPNIELKSVLTIPSDFSFSDHQAVGMMIELK